MKYSTKVSDAVHILAFIALTDKEEIKSDEIAYSIKTNPSCVRQLMSALNRAGLVKTVKGHARPDLSKETEEITLLEVYKAVEGDKKLLHLDIHTNPECGMGVNIQLALGEYFDRVQEAAEREMERITLSDVIKSFKEKVKLYEK